MREQREILAHKLNTATRIFHQFGWKGVRQKLRYSWWFNREKKNYQKWIRVCEAAIEKDRQSILRRIQSFSHQPLISVLLPVYNIEEKFLRLCLESVKKQIYSNWELCIADDCSTKPHIRRVLEEYVTNDARVKVVFRETNGHISAASNSALELATGDFVALLDDDDELNDRAFFLVAEVINTHAHTDMIYSDEDMIDKDGRRYAPKFKPDFSPDLFYSLNLITHLAVYRTSVLRSVGGFRVGFEGSQDYDLALRVTRQIDAHNIRHIPHILYHWRAVEGSVALSADEKPYAHERARQAIREHLHHKNIKATVTLGSGQFHRVIYDLPSETALTVISSGEFDPKKIDYDRFEMIQITEPNASSFNSAASRARGDVVIFLEGKLEPQSNEWLQEMARHALQKETGAVGAKILYSDCTIHHGGIVLGVNGLIGFAHRQVLSEAAGNLNRLVVINNFSAVSGACLAVRKSVFDTLGGFDAQNLPNGLFDVDFCLRLGEKGYRIVWTPYAVMLKDDETVTERTIRRGNGPEVEFFKRRWHHLIENDPYYNPNLTRTAEDFSLRLS